MSQGVSSTPTSTSAAVTSASSAATAPATRSRLLVLAARAQAGVDRNERGRQHAFAEQVLQEVGNAERGVERVGGVARCRSSGRRRGSGPARRSGSEESPRPPSPPVGACGARGRSGAGWWWEGGARRGVRQQALEERVLVLKGLQARFRSSTSASSSSTRLASAGDVGRRRLRALEPPRQRPPDRRIHHDAQDRNEQRDQQESAR